MARCSIRDAAAYPALPLDLRAAGRGSTALHQFLPQLPSDKRGRTCAMQLFAQFAAQLPESAPSDRQGGIQIGCPNCRVRDRSLEKNCKTKPNYRRHFSQIGPPYVSFLLDINIVPEWVKARPIAALLLG